MHRSIYVIHRYGWKSYYADWWMSPAQKQKVGKVLRLVWLGMLARILPSDVTEQLYFCFFQLNTAIYSALTALIRNEWFYGPQIERSAWVDDTRCIFKQVHYIHVLFLCTSEASLVEAQIRSLFVICLLLCLLMAAVNSVVEACSNESGRKSMTDGNSSTWCYAKCKHA
jgi:hypothetical protein